MASPPTPPTPLFAAPVRHLMGVVVAVAGGLLGLYGGEALAYAIAEWTDRDIAELKDMLIWSSVACGVVGLLAGVWLVLRCTRCSFEARRTALIAVGVAVICGALLMLGTFDWPKSAGTPNVLYEIRLPAGMPQPRFDRISVKLWSEKSGSGCYISGLRRDGDRPVIAGSCLITSNAGGQTMSLGLDRGQESHWTMPIRADAKLEKAFGPWQRIEFGPPPRENIPPLPPGEYEVRYRVKKYL
jgi:hypothetical protein